MSTQTDRAQVCLTHRLNNFFLLHLIPQHMLFSLFHLCNITSQPAIAVSFFSFPSVSALVLSFSATSSSLFLYTKYCSQHSLSMYAFKFSVFLQCLFLFLFQPALSLLLPNEFQDIRLSLSQHYIQRGKSWTKVSHIAGTPPCPPESSGRRSNTDVLPCPSGDSQWTLDPSM